MTGSADDLADDNATGGKGRTGKGEDLPTIRRASGTLATNGHDDNAKLFEKIIFSANVRTHKKCKAPLSLFAGEGTRAGRV